MSNNIGMADTNKIKEIKNVLNSYFEANIETGERNPDYDETMDAQLALDEIVQIILN